MANGQLDPNILFQATAPGNISALTRGGATGVQIGSMLDQLQRTREEAPIRKELLEQRRTAGQLAIDQANQEQRQDRENRLIGSLATTYSGVKDLVDTGKFNEAADALEANRAVLQRTGGLVNGTEDTDIAIEALRSGDAQQIRRIQLQGDQAIQIAEARGLLGQPTDERFSATTTNLPGGITVQTTTRGRKIVKDAAGNTLTGQAATDAIASAEERKAQLQIETAGAKEAAKLSARFKLEPSVRAAVTEAVTNAEVVAEQAGEARSNEIAFNVYNTAMDGLISALGETVTGPGAGFIPAVTTNQQVADGAVAAMAPVLKQLFRSSGEGTFTDNDQRLLLQMVPTRKDTADARQSKIRNIDAIVRAKLGVGDGIGGAAPNGRGADTGISAEQFRLMSPEERAATIQRLQAQ